MYKTIPGVYKMFNKISGNCYVGSSKNVSVRISSHKSLLKRGYKDNIRVRTDLNNHGFESFVLEVIEYCDEKIMKDREQYYFDLIKPFYNVWPSVYSAKGRSYTDDQLKSFVGIKRSPFKDKDARSNKMKLAWEKRKLRPDYADWIEKLRNAHIGLVASDEARKNMSLSGKGRRVSPETREKIRRAHLGTKWDKENKTWIKNDPNIY